MSMDLTAYTRVEATLTSNVTMDRGVSLQRSVTRLELGPIELSSSFVMSRRCHMVAHS